MSRDLERAALIREFAAQNNFALRTAQVYAQKGKAEWQDFLRAKSAEAVGVSRSDLPGIPEDVSSPIDYQRAMVAQFRAMLQTAMQDCNRGINTANAATKARAVSILQRSLDDAEKKLEQLQISGGYMVPAERFESLWKDGIKPLVDEVRGLGDWLAMKSGGFDRAWVIQEVQAWLGQKWNPLVGKLVKDFADVERTY